MALTYKDLEFSKTEKGLKVIFLGRFWFDVSADEMKRLGKVKIRKHSIEADEQAWLRIMNSGFTRLRSLVTGRPALYIHRNSGIPLIGTNYFGIIYRNTNLIEVRPITGCNLKCIYCSVDEPGKKKIDYVVEKDYLVDEFKRVAGQTEDIEAHINAQGEPLLYTPIVELVSGLRAAGAVRVSLDTNGTLLTKKLIHDLAKAGLTQLNLSINAVSKELADKISGCKYPTRHVLEMAKEAKRAGIRIVFAPVLMGGVNDCEMGGLIEIAKSMGAQMGIQNFMSHANGRKPVKEAPIEEFLDFLMVYEKRHGIKLVLGPEDFSIRAAERLAKPFRKDQKVNATAVCPGRAPGEMLAVAKDRVIQAHGCTPGRVKVRITRDKHNIFYGICIR